MIYLLRYCPIPKIFRNGLKSRHLIQIRLYHHRAILGQLLFFIFYLYFRIFKFKVFDLGKWGLRKTTLKRLTDPKRNNILDIPGILRVRLIKRLYITSKMTKCIVAYGFSINLNLLFFRNVNLKFSNARFSVGFC